MEQTISSLDLITDKYDTLKSLGYTNITEIPETDSKWLELISTPVSKTALQIFCENSEAGSIHMFNKEFDKLLQHEMVTGNIIEICGESGSGKTQICFQLCINVQLPKWIGGKERSAIYLCSNYNFSTERLKGLSKSIVNKLTSLEISEEKKSLLTNVNTDTILKNIHHMQISSYDEFLAIIIYLRTWLKQQKVGILIIDSITTIIQELDYPERRQFIYKTFNDLQTLAAEHGFLIVVTNNMTIRPISINELIKTPSLGEAYYHRVNSRIILERLSNIWFKARLEKSVVKCQSTTIFQLPS